MHPFHGPGRRQRMERLIMARPMTSLLDKEILLATDMIQPGSDRWVGALVDCGHFVPARDDRTVAWRAIDRRALRADLLHFRRRLTVTRADAQTGGLSLLAIASFCDRLGLGGRPGIPGWLAAMLMRLEPDIGFALLAAAHRQGGGPAPALAA